MNATKLVVLSQMRKNPPLQAVIQNKTGFTVDWPLQDQPPSSVAQATNIAVALGRRLNLLTYADYAAGAGWSNSGGQVAAHAGGGGTATLSQAGLLAVAKTYQIITIVSGRTAGSVIITGTGAVAISANGTATDNITATGTALVYTPTNDFDGSIDVSLVVLQQTNIAASSAFPGAELLNEAGASGTATAANWTAGSSATLTNPTTGVLRIARNGVNNPFVSQSIYTTGNKYRISGEARSDGNASPRIADGVTAFFIGTNSTNWQPFNIEAVAISSGLPAFFSITSTGTEYTEWRNISVTEANPLNGDWVGGVTLGVTGNSRIPYTASFDAATGYGNIYDAALNSMFNPDAGTLICFARSNTWAAGIDLMVRLGVDADNEVFLSRSGTDLILSYDAGGTAESVTIPSGSPTGIFMVALSWDTTGAGAVKAYYNGAQSGSTQTIAGTWVGNLAATLCCIGANSTTPTNVWDGDIAYPTLYNRALSDSEILQIARAGGVA